MVDCRQGLPARIVAMTEKYVVGDQLPHAAISPAALDTGLKAERSSESSSDLSVAYRRVPSPQDAATFRHG